MDGVRTELDRDARRLLILIGSTLEQRVLEHAREIVAAKAGESDETGLIGVDEIQESLRAILAQGARSLELCLSSVVPGSAQVTRRAG